MAQHTVDIATFRLLFPAFADVTKFPDAYIEAQWREIGVTFLDMGFPLMNGRRS